MKATQETQTTYSYKTVSSPVGQLKLVATDRGLAAILWEKDSPKRVRLGRLTENSNHPLLLETEQQLRDYFAGKRTTFSLPFDFAGTAFQKQVWEALMTIPFGKTPSYGEIARRIGRPEAARAVGAAIGRNPISIIVPCHRVIGSNGKLTGFAGGIGIKESLLRLESQEKTTAASATSS
jgi:methylated-DNA-[protein]-cysteine S-methyltransferase